MINLQSSSYFCLLIHHLYYNNCLNFPCTTPAAPSPSPPPLEPQAKSSTVPFHEANHSTCRPSDQWLGPRTAGHVRGREEGPYHSSRVRLRRQRGWEQYSWWIDYLEVRSGVCDGNQCGRRTPEAIPNIFEKIDSDKDFKLSLEEVTAWFTVIKNAKVPIILN